MSVIFGNVVNGQSVSSAFTLGATDRCLLVAVSSHAALGWFASFQLPTGDWLRSRDPWSNCQSQSLFFGSGGGVGLVPYCAGQQVRIETSAAVSATTSFCLIETCRG
jgi:hypothetical protein